MTTIFRVRYLDADRDVYGDLPDDPDTDRLELRGCVTAPRATDPNIGSSEEVHDHARDTLLEGLRLYSHDPRLDVLRGDDIEIDGELWSVEGEPAVWGNDGVTVSLKRSEG